MSETLPAPLPEKKAWQSKTLWAALVVAVAAFFPSVQEIIKGNPEIVGVVLGAIFGVLRFVTKGKIVIE